MTDGPTKADKMRAIANAPSAAPAERTFARQWLTDHKEPLKVAAPVVPSETIVARAQAASTRYARRTGTPLDADAFADDFLNWSAAEFTNDHFTKHDGLPRTRSMPIDKAINASERASRRAEQRDVRAQAREYAQDQLRQMREARERAQERSGRIERDLAGNPIYRRPKP